MRTRLLYVIAAAFGTTLVSYIGLSLANLNSQMAGIDEAFAGLSEMQQEVDMSDPIDAEVARVLQQRFAESPEAVRAVAEAIVRGQTPTGQALSALELTDDSAVPWRPFQQRQPDYRHSLLREAVLTGTAEAAQAIILAGANPNFNDGEMPHLAVTRISDGWVRAFPDYSEGDALLRVWLEAGGDPNVHNAFYGTLGPLLNAVPLNNLESVLTLLAAGADPWRTVVIRTTASGEQHRSEAFLASLANANPTACEVMFRIARDRLIGPGPPDQVERLRSSYELSAENYLGATGPENLHYVWLLQMAVAESWPLMNQMPEGALAELMAMEVPDAIGGFWLAPGEIRSPQDADQIVDNDTQFGSERWPAATND